MAKYDTLDLIAQVKRVESIPTSQATFTDEDFAALLNIEFQSTIVPLIQRMNEEYFVHSEDVTVGVSTTQVTIPPMATGLRLRDVLWVNSEGSFSKLSRLTTDQIGGYALGAGGYMGTSGFYIQNDKLIFYPLNTSSGTLRLNYFRRPNDIVLPNQTGRVIAIDTVLNEILVDNAPDVTTWTTGTKLDALQPVVPFNFRAGAEDFAIVSRSGFTLTVTDAVADALVLGDIISTHGDADVPQFIPVEAMHVLIQSTALRCLEALGDRPGWENAMKKYAQMADDLMNMINPRVAGEPKKIVGAGGILDASRGGNYGGGW